MAVQKDGVHSVYCFENGVLKDVYVGRWEYSCVLSYSYDSVTYNDLTYDMAMSDYRIKVPITFKNGDEWLVIKDLTNGSKSISLPNLSLKGSVKEAFHEQFGEQMLPKIEGIFTDDGTQCGFGSYEEQCFYFFPNHYRFNEVTDSSPSEHGMETRDRPCMLTITNGESTFTNLGFTLKNVGYTQSYDNAKLKSCNIYIGQNEVSTIPSSVLPTTIDIFPKMEYYYVRKWNDGFTEKQGTPNESEIVSVQLYVVGGGVIGSATKDGSGWSISIPPSENGRTIAIGVTDFYGNSDSTMISQIGYSYGRPVITRVEVDDISASGGYVDRAIAYYKTSAMGAEMNVYVSFNSVYGDDLRDNETERTLIGYRSVYVTVGDTRSDEYTFAVYQEANVKRYVYDVISPATTQDDTKYGTPSVSISYDDIPASGGWVAPNPSASIAVFHVYYDVSEVVESYYSYTSGYETEHIVSGGEVDYNNEHYHGTPKYEYSGFSWSFSGDCSSSGVVSASSSSNTTRHPVATVTAYATKYGQTGYATTLVYQEAAQQTGAVYMDGNINSGWYIVNTYYKPKTVIVHFTLTNGQQGQTGEIIVDANSESNVMGTGAWLYASVEILY